MELPLIIAAAQICAEDQNISTNLRTHYHMIKLAAAHGARLLIFPEMSITGYVREAAQSLSFTRYDPRLETMRALSAIHNIVIVAGAPVRSVSGLHIGGFVLTPDGSVSVYLKQHLHPGEEMYFSAGDRVQPDIMLDGEKISLAICFDIENDTHVHDAKEAGSTIYCPGILYSEGSIANAHALLRGYAEDYGINILMSNFCGGMYGITSGGGSAFWSCDGRMLSSLDSNATGLVLGIKEKNEWTGKAVPDNSGCL